MKLYECSIDGARVQYPPPERGGDVDQAKHPRTRTVVPKSGVMISPDLVEPLRLTASSSLIALTGRAILTLLGMNVGMSADGTDVPA